MDQKFSLTPNTFFTNFDIINSFTFDSFENLNPTAPKLVQNLLPKFNLLVDKNKGKTETYQGGNAKNEN